MTTANTQENSSPGFQGSKPIPIPAHVPPERVVNFDFYEGAEIKRCPHESMVTLFRSLPDIFYSPLNDGHWVVTRLDDAAELLQNAEVFSNNPAVSGEKMRVSTDRRIPIDLDAPEHAAFRAILNGIFSPAAVRTMESDIRRFARELVDSVADKGECEFVSEIAQRYPTEIFLDLMGLPKEKRKLFIGWVDQAVRAADPADAREAYRNVAAVMTETLEQRRAAPGSDLLSQLLNKEIEGRPLNEDELLGIAIVLFIGGLDTVVSLLSFIMQFLAEHPDHVRQLQAAPHDLASHLEELIRRHGVANLYRHIKSDIHFKGVQMKAGERVLLPYTILGDDDRNVSDPLTVDFSRPVSRHMTFGGGPHRCLGSHLARLELRVFLEEWFAKIPEFSVRPGADLTHKGGKIVLLEKLPLVWPAR